MNTYYDAISGLGNFSADEKDLILAHATPVTIPAGWAPMVEGTAGDKVYLIVTGEVAIRKNGEEIAQVGPGEIVGETSLARRRLRNATVVAKTGLEVLHFTGAAWRDLTARIPALSAAVDERALVRA